MSRFLSVAFIALSLSSSFAHASFVHTDWKSTGDKKTTLDTSTGIEWLKLTETAGRSINDIKARFSTDLTGWRFATASEVYSMMSKFWGAHWEGRQYTLEGYTAGPLNTAYRDHTTYFGQTITAPDLKASLGTVYEESWGTGTRLSGYIFWVSAGKVEMRQQRDHGYTTSYRNIQHGIYLVNDGGVTLSSQLDPSLNASNPNAPVNQVQPEPADVSSPTGLIAVAFLLMCGFYRLQSKKNQTKRAFYHV